MGAHAFMALIGLTDVVSDLDNSTFRTLRYALSDPTQKRGHRSSERGGEVGEEGGKQAVPQGRTRVLEFLLLSRPAGGRGSFRSFRVAFEPRM